MEIFEFNVLFHSCYAVLCARVNLIVQNHDLAEDLVQDAFVKFWESKPTLLNAEAAPAYVARIAINNALMHLRAQKQQEKNIKEFSLVHSITHNPIEEHIDHQESEQKLFDTLQKLPPACREVFVLSRYEQMSYKEIAALLNISVKTVENQILKALKKLRESLLLAVVLILS
jgi:RNA polymerase sigma-70 factor (ECF subfamily)